MGAVSRIDHFIVAVNLDSLELGEKLTIGRDNWITGFPTGTGSRHFAHQPERRAELLVGEHAAITKHHHIDCTNSSRSVPTPPSPATTPSCSATPLTCKTIATIASRL